MTQATIEGHANISVKSSLGGVKGLFYPCDFSMPQHPVLFCRTLIGVSLWADNVGMIVLVCYLTSEQAHFKMPECSR